MLSLFEKVIFEWSGGETAHGCQHLWSWNRGKESELFLNKANNPSLKIKFEEYFQA